MATPYALPSSFNYGDFSNLPNLPNTFTTVLDEKKKAEIAAASKKAIEEQKAKAAAKAAEEAAEVRRINAAKKKAEEDAAAANAAVDLNENEPGYVAPRPPPPPSPAATTPPTDPAGPDPAASDPAAADVTKGKWVDGGWVSGTGGYNVPNPALDMPPGPERNRIEDKWKTERDDWIRTTHGEEFLNEFKTGEGVVHDVGAEKVAEGVKTDAEAAKTAAEAAAEAADLDKLGPKYDVDAPTWETKGYGTAEGYDSGDPYAVAKFGDQAKIADVEYGDQTMLDPYSMNAQNFNAYRRTALGDVDATSARNLATSQDYLARTGGASTADRMALASQSNRDKIMGRQGALRGLDVMESKNRYDTQAANIGAMNKAQEIDAAEGNLRTGREYDVGVSNAAYDAAIENARIAEIQRQKTQSGANKWSADFGATGDLWSEQNARDRATITTENEKNMKEALLKFGRDSDEYKYAHSRWLLGKQLDSTNDPGDPESLSGNDSGFFGGTTKELADNTKNWFNDPFSGWEGGNSSFDVDLSGGKNWPTWTLGSGKGGLKI